MQKEEKNELPNVSFIKQSLEEFIQSNETYEMVLQQQIQQWYILFN